MGSQRVTFPASTASQTSPPRSSAPNPSSPTPRASPASPSPSSPGIITCADSTCLECICADLTDRLEVANTRADRADAQITALEGDLEACRTRYARLSERLQSVGQVLHQEQQMHALETAANKSTVVRLEKMLHEAIKRVRVLEVQSANKDAETSRLRGVVEKNVAVGEIPEQLDLGQGTPGLHAECLEAVSPSLFLSSP